MQKNELLRDLKARLAAVFRTRLAAVILFGSEARGEAERDSDIDLLVLVHGPLELPHDVRAAIEAVYPVTLATGRPVNPKVVQAREYETFDCPLYRTIRQEGLVA